MEVTAANLAGIHKSFQTKFNMARGSVPGFYRKLCMECPSSAAENVYGWLADLPQIGKVTKEYIKKRLQTLGYRLTNEKWGGILEVKRESITDDQYGMFGNVAAMWGQRAGQAPDLELLQLLINGFSATRGKDYTGGAFFASGKKAHAKATAFTNLAVKKLSADNFVAALANMKERNDAEGVPLYLGLDSSQLYLVVCSDDESTADAIVNLPTLSGGGANPNYKKAQLIVMPGLQTLAQSSSIINDADAKPWFLFDCSQPVKPLIFQPREAFELTPNFSLTSDSVFNEDIFQWKARGRMALGYGLPEYAYGSTGADAA
jgi:phage major head subunit gpT-like protein